MLSRRRACMKPSPSTARRSRMGTDGDALEVPCVVGVCVTFVDKAEPLYASVDETEARTRRGTTKSTRDLGGCQNERSAHRTPLYVVHAEQPKPPPTEQQSGISLSASLVQQRGGREGVNEAVCGRTSPHTRLNRCRSALIVEPCIY